MRHWCDIEYFTDMATGVHFQRITCLKCHVQQVESCALAEGIPYCLNCGNGYAEFTEHWDRYMKSIGKDITWETYMGVPNFTDVVIKGDKYDK